ncbi:hypothetical protein [Nostoc punctiforme]|nr:hypothetical protein [Nostoc punctiforme]
MQRAVAVVNKILLYDTKTTIIVTHGNLMTVLLKHFHQQNRFC